MIGLGGSNLMGIGLAVMLQDSFTKPAAAINKKILELSNNSEKAAAANNSLAMGISSATVAMGAGALYGLYRANEAYIQYNYSLEKVGIIAHESKGQLMALDAQSKQMALNYGVNVDNIMKSNVDLAKAGVQGSAIGQMAEAIATLSKSADEPAEQMGDKLINMMTQFGIASQNSQRFADQLTQAANRSTIDVKDMFQSVSYVGATAHNLRIPFEQVATQIALIGNAGIRGSSGGTQLANMYRYLAQSVSEFPLKRQQEALSALKISPRQLIDSKGNLKNIGDLLDLFQKHTRGMASTRVQNLSNMIFGPRGSRAFIALMAQGRKAYDDMYEDITTKSNGIAKSMALKLADTPEGKVQKMKEQWHQFVLAIGQSINPLINVLVPVLTSVLHLVTSIASNPIGHILISIGAGYILMRTGIAAVRLLQLGYNSAVLKSGNSNSTMARIQAVATGSMKTNLLELIGLQKEYNAEAAGGNIGGMLGGPRMRYGAGSKNKFGDNIGGTFMGEEAATAERAYTAAYASEAAGVAAAGEAATVGLSGLGATIAEFAMGPWGLFAAGIIAIAPALDNFGPLGRAIHAVVDYIETLITTFSFDKAYKSAANIMDSRNTDGSPDKRFGVRSWERDDNLNNMVLAMQKQTHSTTINLTVDGKSQTQKYTNLQNEDEINSIMNL